MNDDLEERDEMMGKGDPNEPVEGESQKSPGELIQVAKGLLYGDNFESMINVFQTAGLDGFPQAMATVVIGTLERLEGDFGEQDPRVLLAVAVGLVAMLSTDLVEGKVLDGLDGNKVQIAIQAIVGQWMKNHPDRADVEQVKQLVLSQAQGGA